MVESRFLSLIRVEKPKTTSPSPSLHRRGVLFAHIYNRTQVPKESLGQNLHLLSKLGDQSGDGHGTGSGSGMTKLRFWAFPHPF